MNAASTWPRGWGGILCAASPRLSSLTRTRTSAYSQARSADQCPAYGQSTPDFPAETTLESLRRRRRRLRRLGNHRRGRSPTLIGIEAAVLTLVVAAQPRRPDAESGRTTAAGVEEKAVPTEKNLPIPGKLPGWRHQYDSRQDRPLTARSGDGTHPSRAGTWLTTSDLSPQRRLPGEAGGEVTG